jgi:hypothetical protein
MLNVRPNALIYGARYDRMMEAPGLRRVEDPKNLRGALDEAMTTAAPPRQRRDFAERRPQAAAVPLAQLSC